MICSFVSLLVRVASPGRATALRSLTLAQGIGESIITY